MADAYIQLPPQSTGLKVDTTEIAVGANTVERERHNIADPSDAAGLAKVENTTPGASDYGLVTRNIPSGTQTVSVTGNPAENLAQIAGNTVDSNSGTKSAGTLRVVLATDQPALTNALKVDGSAVTQPVSGTVTANAGSGTFNVADANLELAQGSATAAQVGPLIQGAVTTSAPTYSTTKTDPLSLDTSGNLRVSLKDTPSNTNNLNVNLAASAATVTVSGTVSVNPITFASPQAVTEATLDAALIAQEATTSGVKGIEVFGAVTTNAPTYTTAKSDALSLDTSGLLRTSLKDTPSNTNNLNVNLAASAATVTVSGTVTTTPPANASTNIAQINGSTVTVATGNVPLVGIEGHTGTSLETTAGVLDVNIKNVNNAAEGNSNPLFVRVTDGTNNMPTGDASARTIHTTIDNASIAVTGSFSNANVGTLNTTAPTSGSTTAGVDGNSFLRALRTDTQGYLVVSSQSEQRELLYQILLELRAMKFAIVAMATGSGNPMSAGDFEPSNFQDQSVGPN